MQCGIACLQMVCKYFGREYSLDSLSKICFATTEGVSMLGINEAARILGFQTVSARATIEELSESPLPCILHWNQNHFVVLYKVKKGKKFYIADPGKGKTTYNLEEFRRHWISTRSGGEDKGIAMFFATTPAFFTYQMEGEERQKEKRSFKFLFRYFKKYRKAFTWIVLGLLAGSALQLVLPFLTQSIVDVGIKNQDIGFIWLILLGQLMLTVSRTAIDFARRWFLLRISMRINISLVSDFFIKLLKLPMSFFDTKLMGDLMQRMSDHSRVNNFLTQQTLNITFAMLTFVVFSVVLFIYNKVVFAIFLLGSILYGGWMALFLRRRKVLDYELFEQQAINNNRTYEFITSMQEIKLQDCEQRKRKEWEETQVNLFRVQQKSLKLQQTQEAGSIFINEVKNIVVTVVAATAVIQGHMTLGMMLAVQYIRKTIDGVDILIPQGKVTAIVGASGSGKTTLIRLMLGYYPVLEGKITIGDTDINQLNRKWWRRQCGVVMQEGVIFSESIGRNIAVDDAEIDQERLMRAAEIACIKDYVMALPLKFNTKIGRDGVGLSQGQKQRILIARAVYKNPDYIFLDEATNSLDANNERSIVENLDKFYQGKTVVIVAHRLSTVKNADQIVVLDQGKVVEIGNHESLTAKRGAYYNLVKNQLELGN